MGDLYAPPTDEIARAIGLGVYGTLPANVALLANDIAVAANNQTNVFQNPFGVTTPQSPRDIQLLISFFQVAVLMGATAGVVSILTDSAPPTTLSIPANSWGTLLTQNIGTIADGALTSGSCVIKSTQACTVKKLDSIFNQVATFGVQVFVWQ